VLHQVGAGTLGPVFRAHDAAEGRLVAVKAFTLDLDPDQARRLAAALDELPSRGLDHPSIAQPVAAGLQGTLPWFAQAYVPAESLDAALRQYGPAPIRDALAVVIHLAGALDHAATSGVLHGSLHSRDILVAPDETRVIDLGVAQALERCGLRPPIRRPYAAPERVDGGPVTRAADIFSLAVVAYELFTGQRPVGFGDTAVTGFPAIEGANRDALLETFAFALAQAPDERYASGAAFVASLKRALGDAAYLGIVAVPHHVPPGPSLADLPTRPHDLPVPAIQDLPTKPHSIALPDPMVTSPVDVLAVTGAPPIELAVPPVPLPEEPGSPASTKRSRSIKTPVPPAVSSLPETMPAATTVDYSHDGLQTQPTSALETLPLINPLPSDPHQPPSAADAPLSHAGDADVHQDVHASTPVRPVPPHSPGRAPGLQAPFAALATALIVGLAGGLSLGYVVWGHRVPASIADGTMARTAPAADAAVSQPTPVEPPPAPVVTSPSTAGQQPPASAQSAKPAAAKPSPQPAPTPARPTATAAPKSDAQPGRLVLRSTPSGARVEINGKPHGTTPLTLQNLPFGILMVRLERAGYQPLQRRVVLNANRPVENLNLPLVKAPGSAVATSPPPAAASNAKSARADGAGYHGVVLFESRPTGAKVFIDNTQVGVTPLQMPGVRAGSHAVRFELDGFKRWSASVRVVAGERTRVAASLEEVTAR
jgi:serine/threonine protein kinase